jgi:hypothetical protein
MQFHISLSGMMPASEDIYLFCFFWIGFLIFRTDAFRKCFCPWHKARCQAGRLIGFSCLREDFAHRRYEQVLESWPQLEDHTAEALSLVVSSLLALGRPDDIGVFIAKTCANLSHLVPGLHHVVAAMGAPACEVPGSTSSAPSRMCVETPSTSWTERP